MSNKKIVALIGVFIVVVLGGRLFSSQQNAVSPSTILKNQEQPKANTPTQTSESLRKTLASSTETAADVSCSETIKKDLASKKQSYAKGQILVTFNTNVSYGKAKDVLAVYGLVVQNEVQAQVSFTDRHYVTAAVAPGEEITKVCLLRDDSNVKYAGLDVYFGLHQ